MSRSIVATLALMLSFVGVVGGYAEAAKSKPDLIVSAVSAPSPASPDATIVVSGTVKNQGKASSKAFSVAYYLSTSPSSTTGAAMLGTGNVSSLAAGASMALVTSFTVPGSTASGTFYVVAVADSTKVISESNEANNTGSSGTITIESIAPPSIVPVVEYYVSPTGNDTADGSTAYPWATIQHAADSVGPGAIVHVAPGDYLQAIVSRASGTATARIRFVSDTHWGAKIKSTGSEFVWENRGNYMDIVGFDISSDDARIGIVNFADLGYVRIVGNHVHDFPGTGCTSLGGAGILQDYWYGATNSDTIGNVVDHIGPSGCNLVHGIYHSMKGGNIHNNIVHNAAGWGIHTWHAATEVTIANNLVFKNGSGGIVVGAGDSPGGVAADGFTVSNNIVMDNGYGIMEYGQTGVNNRYLNNLVYENLYNGFQLQNGNVDLGTVLANAQFVNYQPDGSGDYHLTPGSPAIDSGTSVEALSDDFDGVARPQGAGWDIGPYEWRP